MQSRVNAWSETTNDPILLTVIIPAFNEEATIDGTIRRVQRFAETLRNISTPASVTAGYYSTDQQFASLENTDGPTPITNGSRTVAIRPVSNSTLLHHARLHAHHASVQIIVVNDGSTDRTADVLGQIAGAMLVLHHVVNQGKGAAIQTAIPHAKGTYTVVQDADREYDPSDLLRLLEAQFGARQECAVYGSRYLQRNWGQRPITLLGYGVFCLNYLARILCRVRLTDICTCYKMMPTRLLRQLEVSRNRFEYCTEVTAKLSALGIPIIETPISYVPRTYSEGKKIRLLDGIGLALTLWRFRKWKGVQTR